MHGTLKSAADGVLLQTAQGIEALRCSGLPETFSFESSAGLSAQPPCRCWCGAHKLVTRQVTLSYLARGFDWAADYTATLSADGGSLDLGAWVTLANCNGVGFPAARTQVVAGKLNRANGEVEPIDVGGPILAQCWPRGSTTDPPMILRMNGGHPPGSLCVGGAHGGAGVEFRDGRGHGGEASRDRNSSAI